jgi:hypothetical protein
VAGRPGRSTGAGVRARPAPADAAAPRAGPPSPAPAPRRALSSPRSAPDAGPTPAPARRRARRVASPVASAAVPRRRRPTPARGCRCSAARSISSASSSACRAGHTRASVQSRSRHQQVTREQPTVEDFELLPHAEAIAGKLPNHPVTALELLARATICHMRLGNPRVARDRIDNMLAILNAARDQI